MLKELKEIKKVMNKMRIPVERNYKKEPNILEQKVTITKFSLEGLNSRFEQAKELISKLKTGQLK